MSSFSRFDPAGGLKGTLPGGIFEPLLADQRDLPSMPGRRPLLKSQNRKASSGSSTHVENRELNNFDDIASSRPVPLTALSARTGSRNKGSKNWRPFAFDDASEDDSGSSVALPETTRSKVRSRLSESVSYNADNNEDSSVGAVSADHGEVSRSHGREQPLDARNETRRFPWPRGLDPQIQQNPLSYSTGYGAFRQSRLLDRPRNPNLLNSASYALWPSPVLDESVAVNGIQQDQYLFPDGRVMPGSFYQVQDPGVYDVPRYKMLPHRRHRDPIDTQYAPMLRYSMSQPEYEQLAGYDPIPSKNALLGTTRSISNNMDGSPLIQEALTPTVVPDATSHRVSDPTSAPTQAIADASGHTTGNGRPEKTVEERKLALRNAVLKKIAQDEQELSQKIERERKRVLEQEKEEKDLEQKIKQDSEPSFENAKPTASPDQSSGSSQDAIPAAALLPDFNHGSLETGEARQRESERKRKALRDAVLAKIEEDRREQEQKLNDGQNLKRSLKAIRDEKIRDSPTRSSSVGSPSPGIQETSHADAAGSPLEKYSRKGHVKDELPAENAEALEITVTPQSVTTSTGKAPMPPPGLPKPTYHNPTALSRAFEDYHVPEITRIKEANDWFHRDGRGENEFRRRVTEIANEYALECEQVGNDAYYSKEDKDVPKQMTLLMGNVVANLKSYAIDDKGEQPDYFANFEPVRSQLCEPGTGDVHSYFEEEPTRVQTSPSPERSCLTVGKKVLVNRSSKSLANDK